MNESQRTILARDPIARIAAVELDRLLTTLDVNYLMLARCLVSSGNRLQLPAIDIPGMHYNLTGSGSLVASGMPPIKLRPHTLVIMPPNRPFRLEAANNRGQFKNLAHVDYAPQFKPDSFMQRFVAGDANSPEILLICGVFKASYGLSIDVFGRMNS